MGLLTSFEAVAPDIAQAGAVEEEPATIIVTGSRIARPDLTSNSPISVISADTFKLSGATSVEDVLRDIPQAVPGIGGQTNNGNEGAATIDLRNLTEQRT